MINNPGVYRVIYNLPGSIGYCSQQFIYKKCSEDSLTDVAEKCAVEKESKRYNVNKSKINILDIEYIRNISENQKTLKNSV